MGSSPSEQNTAERTAWQQRWHSLSPGVQIAVSTAGVAAVALLAQLPAFDRSIVPMDEGHLSAVAAGLLEGKLLYRDLHTGIFPGVYHFAAFLFSVFGEDFIVTRWAQVVVNTVIALCLWRVSDRAVRSPWALLPPLLYLALVAFSFPVLTMLNYSTLSLCLALAALLFLLRYLETARTGDGIALGLLLAASALTKQNFGGLALVAIGIGLAWGRSGSALQRRSWVSASWPILVSGSAAGLAALGYFISTGTLGHLLEATLLSLGGSQLEAFHNPIPPVLGAHPAGDSRFVFLYSPPMVFGHLLHAERMFGFAVTGGFISATIRLSYGACLATLAAIPLLLWLSRDGGGTAAPQRRAIRSISVFAVLFFPGIFPSAIWSHLAFVLVPLLPLYAVIGNEIGRALGRRSATARRRWNDFGAVVAVLTAIACVQLNNDIRRWHPDDLGLERASLQVSRYQGVAFRGGVSFIESCAAPGEPIFVAPDMPIFYFLTDRPNPTPYDLTIPGDVDGSLIIRRLEDSGTRCILYNPTMYPEFPPFRDLFPELAHYLNENFEKSRLIGEPKAPDSPRWLGLVRKR